MLRQTVSRQAPLTKSLLLTRDLENVRRSFLRIEKNFVQNVTTLLKQSLIQQDTPPFAHLIDQAERSQNEIMQAGETYRDSVRTAGAAVAGTLSSPTCERY
jgi:hypothetical protein